MHIQLTPTAITTLENIVRSAYINRQETGDRLLDIVQTKMIDGQLDYIMINGIERFNYERAEPLVSIRLQAQLIEEEIERVVLLIEK